MKKDTAYEIIDGRKGAELNGVGVIVFSPDQVAIYTNTGQHLLMDGDAEYDDDEETGTVLFYLPEGKVTCVQLSLASVDDLDAFLVGLPKFTTDEEVGRYFYQQYQLGEW